MLQVRILVFLILLVLIDFYFYQAVKKVCLKLPKRSARLIKFAYFTFTAAAFCFVLSALVTDFGNWPKSLKSYFTSIFFIISISKFTGLLFIMGEDIVRGIRVVLRRIRSIGKTEPAHAPGEPISRSAFISNLAIATAAVPFSTLVFGMIKGAFDYKVFHVPLQIPGLPEAFRGVKIAQISDIHTGSFTSQEPLKEAVDLLLAQNPDYIFFTGDLVNDRTDEALPYGDLLSKIQAPGGVFSVLGNHDYGDYSKWPTPEAKAANLLAMHQFHREIGWDLLLNEHRELERNGQSITVVGVENWSGSPRFTKYGDMDQAIKGANPDSVKLLLSHDPSHWDGEVRKTYPDVAVTFSGHTHGMQFGIELPGLRWSPSQYIYEQWAGLYSDGYQQIYVNRGLGFLGYSGRVGIRPEITIFELQPAT